MVDEAPETDGAELRALETIPMVLAYVVSIARGLGEDESDLVELVGRGCELSQDTLREAERTLKPLGYKMVAQRLRKLSRRKRCN